MKAVILTAGLGTRFLPITKVVPKALLPIGNKPIIHLLVEEALASGIKEIAIIISPNQNPIKEYFTNNPDFPNPITFIVQEEPLGDGHAILQAKEFLADSPFAVLFGDDLIVSETPAIKQLLTLFEEKNAPILATQRVPKEDISKYGVVSLTPPNQVTALIEKPSQKEAPSDFAVIGKYICTPETIKYLEKAQASHSDGEIRLIDGFISMLADQKQLFALEIDGTRFDTGHPEGLLQAQIAFSEK
jgi:UTP--glucose-1-phosphate uridylyltransferase